MVLQQLFFKFVGFLNMLRIMNIKVSLNGGDFFNIFRNLASESFYCVKF